RARGALADRGGVQPRPDPSVHRADGYRADCLPAPLCSGAAAAGESTAAAPVAVQRAAAKPAAAGASTTTTREQAAAAAAAAVERQGAADLRAALPAPRDARPL